MLGIKKAHRLLTRLANAERSGRSYQDQVTSVQRWNSISVVVVRTRRVTRFSGNPPGGWYVDMHC